MHGEMATWRWRWQAGARGHAARHRSDGTRRASEAFRGDAYGFVRRAAPVRAVLDELGEGVRHIAGGACEMRSAPTPQACSVTRVRTSVSAPSRMCGMLGWQEW